MSTCIEGAVNFAPSLYGFFRNHLSWEWMFWFPALAHSCDDGVHLSSEFHRHQNRKPKRNRPVLSDSFMSAPALRCCLPLSIRGSVSTGGDRALFTALFVSGMFLAVMCSCRGACAVRTFLSICLISASGTRSCWEFALFTFRFVPAGDHHHHSAVLISARAGCRAIWPGRCCGLPSSS